eukprot:7669904-Alexandrium_andersonii.AAC.1
MTGEPTAENSAACCTTHLPQMRCAAAMVHEGPGLSPRRREAVDVAITAHGAPRTDTAAQNP